MNLFKEAYFSKSGMIIGKELKHCFDCSYCRANNHNQFDFTKYLPSELNPNFINIPVFVNLFYGDPTLQIEETYKILKRLEDVKHKGYVVLITKGLLKNFTKFNWQLNIHYGLSTFGVNSQYDGGSIQRFEDNLIFCEKNKLPCSIEFRPIIKNINDSEDVLTYVAEIAKKYNVGVGYCGLQVSEETRKRLEDENIIFEPYDSKVGFGLKKFISKDVEDSFRQIAKDNGVNIFKKTSCLIATANGQPDYNAHYYRPNEVGCNDCPNKNKCHEYKEKLFNEPNLERLEKIIPFNFEIVNKTNHICTLYKNGLCEFPSKDCMNINGKMISINNEITTTDVRLIKWLTGYTVDAKFIESPYMSEVWMK